MKIVKIAVEKRILKIKDCGGVSSLRGLMFDDMKDKDGALIYGNSIWMPFIRQNLNLVFLDKNMKITGTKIAVPISRSINTWKTYGDEKARYCLELKDTGIKVKKGTKIKFIG